MRNNQALIVWRIAIIFAAGLALYFLFNGRSLTASSERDTSRWATQAGQMLNAGEIRSAEAIFNQQIAQNRTDPDTYLICAAICQATKRWELAIRYTKLGLTNCPKAPVKLRVQLMISQGESLQRIGNIPAAIQVMEVAYRIDPNDPVTLNALGYTYADDKVHLNQALSLTTRAVSLATKDSNITKEQLGLFIDSLGWAYYRLGQIQPALEYLQRAVGLAAREHELHYHLAMAYLAAKRPRDAYVELRTALMLDPNNTRDQMAITPLEAKYGTKAQPAAAQPPASQSEAKPPIITSAPKSMPAAVKKPVTATGPVIASQMPPRPKASTRHLAQTRVPK
ncbi:MAG: tetratricopeptide repeat protein [Armatimonadetes bacterium]|nr:tetratricopeptide repeat protein [Armatimonadota bacterium]